MFSIKSVTNLSLLFIVVTACHSGSQSGQPDTDQPVVRGSYRDNIAGMVDIHTQDHYNRSIDRGHGFFVDTETVVTNLSVIQGAYRARIAAPGTQQYYRVNGYTAYDLEKDLVLLQVQRRNNNFLPPVAPIDTVDTLYTLTRPENRLMVQKSSVSGYQEIDSAGYYCLRGHLESGKPAFYGDHGLAGIVQNLSDESGEDLPVVLDGKWISHLMKHQHEPLPIIDLSGKSTVVYPSHETIRGFRIITDMGHIEIRLYDETPRYRDNFIRLVTDQYYDSLLIHRVLRSFLIQTGAADTRNAAPNGVVGWQGPGYTLPMNLVPGIYHKRGAVAASKLPDARNPRDESDGSQFYIIAGRRFTDSELDDLEAQKGMTYTAEQRHTYRTLGGAPHLDNNYTVFAEVTAGMEVVDKISLVETGRADRPIMDIRIRTIEILYK